MIYRLTGKDDHVIAIMNDHYNDHVITKMMMCNGMYIHRAGRY